MNLSNTQSQEQSHFNMKPWQVLTIFSYIVCLAFFVLLLADILDKYFSKAKITQVNQLSFEKLELPLMVLCPTKAFKGPISSAYNDEEYSKNIYTLQDLFHENTTNMLKSGYVTYTMPSVFYGACQAIQKLAKVEKQDYRDDFILKEEMDVMIYFIGETKLIFFFSYIDSFLE